MPITWKNIDAPDFRSSMVGVGAASDSFERAGNSLSGIFARANKVDNANWDNQANINTEDAVARLRGLVDMNTYNAQEQYFDPTALRGQFGRQINNDTIQAELLKRKGVLTGEAVGAAGSFGLDQAKATLSASAAAEAFRQKLIDSGIKDPNVLNAEVTKFTQQTLAPVKDSWKEAGDKMVTNTTGQLLAQGPDQQQSTQTQSVSQAGGNTLNNTIMPMIFKHEGGYNSNDGNGYPVNMGINGKYHPDVDIKGLTKEKATQIYQDKYWKAIDGDNLPPQVATMAMDIAVNQGPAVANRIVAQSKGDLNTMLQLRKQQYQEVVLKNPDKAKYMKTWMDRADKTAAVAQGLTPSQQVGQQILEAEKAGVPLTSEQVGSLRSIATEREKDQRATTVHNQDQAEKLKKIALEENTLADSAIMQQMITEDGGDTARAYKYIQGAPHEAQTLAKVKAINDVTNATTELQKLQDAQHTAETTTAIEIGKSTRSAALGNISAELDSKDGGISKSPLLEEANKSPGGIVDVLAKGADKAGWWATHLPGLGVEFGNDLKDGMNAKVAELRGQKVPDEVINRIMIRTLRDIGGNRQGVSGNSSVDMDEFNDAYSGAIQNIKEVGGLQGKYEALKNSNLTDDKLDDSALKTLDTLLKQARIKANAEKKPLVIPEEAQKIIDANKGKLTAIVKGIEDKSTTPQFSSLFSKEVMESLDLHQTKEQKSAAAKKQLRKALLEDHRLNYMQ